jgi:hypothetical protein
VSDPAVHQASYECADRAALDRAMSGEALKTLVADFNREWGPMSRAPARPLCWRRSLRQGDSASTHGAAQSAVR